MASKIKRLIKAFPRDANGKYIQPDENSPELETIMDKNRQYAAVHFQLADEHGCGDGHTYDKTGNNVCWTCNQYLKKTNDCLAIEDIVPGPDGDIKSGSSCRHYENKRAGDWEVKFKRTTKEAALFGTAINGKGFGCGSPEKQRCGWRETGKWQDSVGRGEWCGAMYFTTTPTTCCAINSTPTIEDQGKKKDKKEAKEYAMPISKYINIRRRT